MNDRPLYTRRDFLSLGLKTAGLVSAWGYVPAFLTHSALAATPGKDQTILVVVQLSGGNDGLNTVVPYVNDAYYRLRPKLGLKKDALWTVNDQLGLHSALSPLRPLYDDGRVSVIQNVGYPNPNRSHFRSMEIFQTGSEKEGPKMGWLGRYFDNQCQGADPRNAAEAEKLATIGISMGKVMPQAYRNQANVALALDNPETFRWNASGETSGLARAQESIFAKLNKPAPAAQNNSMMGNNMHGEVRADSAETLDFLKHTAMNAVLAGDRVRELLAKYKGKVNYPQGGLAGQLQMVAKLIAGQMPTRVYYVHQGGYDTHANQLYSHERLLGELAASLKAFQEDIALQGNADKVMCLAFSEFGRRVAENGSAGTDHGAAGPMFAIGPKLKAGVHGGVPDLTDLIDGDIRHQTDFRQVYASVLEDWLGVSSAGVLGQPYEKLGLV
jgi:uncharacterized protein (DUF1501 family)